MKRATTLILAASMLAAQLFTSSCSKKEETATKGKIGYTCSDITNPFFKLIANSMTEEAAKYGYQLVALNGGQDPAKQNSQITDFVAQGYDAIFLNPVDSISAGEGVRKAHAAGIPVFTFDVQVLAKDAKDLVTSHIGSDNYQGGLLAGESMMKATGDKGTIAILGLPEASSCILRVNGFRDYLKEHNSKLNIVTELSGKGSVDGGYAVTTDMLQAHPDIVGVFAVNDPSALGAYSAINKAGKTDQIKIVAFDASPAGKQAVFENKFYDTPQQFPRKMATGTVEAFIKHLDGEEVSKTILIPCAHYYHDDAVIDESRVAEQW